MPLNAKQVIDQINEIITTSECDELDLYAFLCDESDLWRMRLHELRAEADAEGTSEV